jgi:hypothetical protein
MSGRTAWSHACELVDGLPRPDSEFGRLAAALLDGSLTRPERDRLEAMLKHADARRAYRKLSRLHANLLCLWHEPARAEHGGPPLPEGGRGSGRPTTPGRKQPSARSSDRFAAAVAVMAHVAAGWLRACGRPVPFACLVAGVVMAAGLAGFSLVRIDPAARLAGIATTPTADSVAFVADVHGVRWSGGRQAAAVGDFLAPGARLEIAAGLVEVMYFGGARVVVEGPASFSVTGPTAGRLDAGRIVAKTDHPARATAADDKPWFTVLTPRGVIDDLGTEFGVDVPRSGDESVHVFEGLVAVATSEQTPGPAVTVQAGRTVAIDHGFTIRRALPTTSRRFVRALPQPQARKPLAQRSHDDQPRVPRAAVWHGENVEEFSPVRARFVRFTILECSNAHPGIDELEIIATDGRNVARDGRATASGTIAGHAIHAVAHVNDGIYGNDHSWICDSPRGWVQIELAEEAEIERVVWSRDRASTSPYVDRVPTKYLVSVSADGKVWRNVASSGSRLPFGSPRLPQEEAVQ